MNGNRLPLACVRARNAADLGSGDEWHRHLATCFACRSAGGQGLNLSGAGGKETDVPLPPPWEAVLKRIEPPEAPASDVHAEASPGWSGVPQLAVSCALFLLLAIGARETSLRDVDAGRGERKLLALAGRAFEHYRVAVMGGRRVDVGTIEGGKEP